MDDDMKMLMPFLDGDRRLTALISKQRKKIAVL